MPRFAGMLQQSFVELGHTVKVWAPKAISIRLFSKTKLAKWAGYVDQYLFFPIWVRFALLSQPANTLFVFCDQALGPWVPLVRRRPHVVHAHDLLALRSAMGLIPENPTSWSGKLYQEYIRAGFKTARHFISVSTKTKLDLIEFGKVLPVTSEVVYNGLNYPFKLLPFAEARQILCRGHFAVPAHGVLLHISGNQWYKNVVGVIHIYAEYVKTQEFPIPLWLVGVSKSLVVITALKSVPLAGKVEFLYQLSGEQIHAAYAIARVFIFPSHAEGFGWPIVEAQACGCAVLTTNEPPMNEIGGPECNYLPRLTSMSNLVDWSQHGARVINQILSLNPQQEAAAKLARVTWASQFNSESATANYISIYKRILDIEKL